jgi:Ca-activated chloride channel family protein
MNYYNLLELPLDATQEEIRKAYFDLAKKFHPDINAADDTKDKFIKIQRAYEVLSDAEKRKEYNLIFKDKENIDANMQVNAYYSRSSIPLISERQYFYLLLDLFSTEKIDDRDIPSVNLSIVIDKSTSMQGVILDNLKIEIGNLIRLLKDEDIVSIVSFSDKAEVVIPPVKTKNLSNEIIKINQINASGSTEIYKGLREGVNLLLKDESQQTKLLLLITDGHTYGDEKKCTELIQAATQNGIVFQAIGVGIDWNDDFLDSLSSIAGGETQFVTTSQELYNLLQLKIKNFGVIYSKSARITFNLNPNVKLNYAFRLNPDLSKLEITNEINLGNLYIGKHLRVIFEFLIEELPIEVSELRFSRGSIKLVVPSKTISTKRYFYDFKRPVLAELKIEKIPPVIVDALSKLSLYRLQEKAREDVNEGNFESATKRLNNLATHLLSIGDKELAKTIIKEVEYLHDTKHFSELGKKKMKYGTRSLLMLPKS